MTTTYKTLDYLDDLTTDMMAIATPLTFESATTNSSGWDYQAFYFSENGIKHDLFSFQGNENAIYDIAAISYMIPDMVTIVDNLGNVLNITTQEFDEDNTYSTSDLGGLMLPDFVAPYTGTYYVAVTFDKGFYSTSTYLSINEDVDTATNIDKTLTFINSLATGEITISGTAKQDEILTVSSSLADEDGLGDFEYQWLRDGAEIFDATAETYKPLAIDIGKKISVKVSYIDGEGTLETVTSLATAVVTGKSATTGNDLLIGTNGNDKISGLAGNDTLVGGLGKDNLTGGTGADVFKFSAINETGKTSATRDVITDFKHSEGDKIDLSGMDANSKLAEDQAFKFIGSKSFSGTAGEIRFDSTNKILYGNVNSDKVPDFAIQLNGVKSLIVDDFVL